MTTDAIATVLANATPDEIDTALAEIYGRYYTASGLVASHDRYIKDARSGLAKFEAGDRSYSCYSQESLNRLLEERAVLADKASAILTETDPYDEEFDRRPWSRFFLVKNNGGHIHSSMRCSTCFSTTKFGWLPEISGLTEAEAVAQHGAILCTVCYPTAPTSWTDGTKPGDEDVCTGSGTYFDRSLPHRFGYYSGNYGTCTGCGTAQTVSKAGKIRKHKR